MASSAATLPTKAVPHDQSGLYSAPAQNHTESDYPTHVTYELLLRDARTEAERAAIASVIALTVGADPPRPCASIDAVAHHAGIDQFAIRFALAVLDQRKVLRLVDECGEVWVMLRSLRIAEVMR